MLSWHFFKNYLLSRRSGALVRIIAWNCIVGIGMGVAALIIVLSVMNGFNLTIRSRMLSVEPHLIVQNGKVPDAARLTELREKIEQASRQGVEVVQRYESQDVILRSAEGLFQGAIGRGYDREGMGGFMRRAWANTNSQRAPPSDLELEKDEIALGVDLARSLNLLEGDEVIIIPPESLLLPKGEIPKFQKFKVKALVSTQISDFDSKLMFYNIDSFPQRVRSIGREAGVEVRLIDPYEAETIKRRLASAHVESQTWGERDLSLFFALKMESLAMTLFLSLAVLITSFSIVIIMVLLMRQKRQDIGMLMSMGLSLRQTKMLFLQVGLLLSAMGVLGGVTLGAGVCLFLDLYPLQLLPEIYTDATLPAKMTWGILFGVLLGTSGLAVIGSWLPVWRSMAQTPAESLRRG